MTLRRSLLPLVFSFVSCAPPPKPAPTARLSRPSVTKDVVEPPLPRSPDITREVMGWVVISDGARLVRQFAPASVEPARAAELAHAMEPALEAQLFSMVGLDPLLAQVIDLKRPAGLALLNPGLLSSATVKPYVAMVPVTSRAAVEKLLHERDAPVEREPWGYAVGTRAGKVYVGFAAGYALVAWRPDLLEGARRQLLPRLLAHAEAPLKVHVDLENVYASFGRQLDAFVGRVLLSAERGADAPDPQLVYALRGLRQVTRSLDSVSAVEVLADVDSGGLTFTVRLDGKSDGAWHEWVRAQEPGPAWGIQYLPRDAVMVYTTRSSPRCRADDARAALAYLEGASPSSRPANDQVDRWRRALERGAGQAEGQLAYAVWPGRRGGVGIGGAYRVSDPAGARAVLREMYGELGPALGAVVVRALLLDPARFAPRASTHQRAARLGGVDIELVEISLRWPSGADGERRAFEALFGPKLTLATAFVGDQALFALGADWAERLDAMLATARGETAASVGDEPAFAEALAYHDRARVSLSYLETGRMARFAAGLIAQVGELDEPHRVSLNELVDHAGSGAIISTTNVSGARYEVTTHVPQTALLGTARLNGVLWRMALSPLLNPPSVPPLPIPPPHVTPPLRPAADIEK